MSDDRKSYRQILRSTSIIGGASVINILVGLVRIKVAAVLLGPAGVGLIGLLTSLAGTASTIAGLGIGNVGTRQIAKANGLDNVDAMAAARRALFWGTLALAVLGSAIFWAFRGVLALRLLGDASLSTEVGWLALVVGFTVAAASQSALLNGMRRIGDMAKVSVLSALLSTLFGVGALLIWGRSGLIVFVAATPLASFVLGHIYAARIPKIISSPTPLPELSRQWSVLARLGIAFMIAGVAGMLGQLLVRTLVQKQLGLDALGYFQAATTISITYIGFVLTAMGTDYYPRLTAAIDDHSAVNRMVNEQTEIALLLAAPILAAMMGFAPWVIELLYASSFYPATAVLRWQVLGDVLKICSWPLGFIILAAGDGRTFMLTESVAVGVFVLLTWILLPFQGVVATGLAFLGMYLVYLPLVYALARRRTGFRWSNRVLVQVSVLLFVLSIVMLAGWWSAKVAAISGLLSVIWFVLYGLERLDKMVKLTGSVGKALSLMRRFIYKVRLKSD